MNCYTIFQVLEVGNYSEVLLKFAVDLRKEIDLDQIEAFAKFVHLLVDFEFPCFDVAFELCVEILEVAEIKDIVLLEVYCFYFLVASQQLWLHVYDLSIVGCFATGLYFWKPTEILAHELKIWVETHLLFIIVESLFCFVVLYFFGEEVGGELIEWGEDVLSSNCSYVVSNRFWDKFVDVSDILFLWCVPKVEILFILVLLV